MTPKRRSSEAYIEGRVRGLRVGLQGGAAVKPARVPSGPTTRALLHYLDNRLRIDGSSRVPLDEFGAWASASGHRFVPERIAEAAALLSGQVYAVSHGEVYQGQIIEGLFAREAGGSFVDIDPGLRRAYRVA